jgi:hypothetical protein
MANLVQRLPSRASGSARAVGERSNAAPSAADAPSGCSVLLELDAVQTAWLDAIADLHGVDRASVLREALRRFSACESERVSRTTRYQAIALACRAERWNPVADYLAGQETEVP